MINKEKNLTIDSNKNIIQEFDIFTVDFADYDIDYQIMQIENLKIQTEKYDNQILIDRDSDSHIKKYILPLLNFMKNGSIHEITIILDAFEELYFMIKFCNCNYYRTLSKHVDQKIKKLSFDQFNQPNYLISDQLLLAKVIKLQEYNRQNEISIIQRMVRINPEQYRYQNQQIQAIIYIYLLIEEEYYKIYQTNLSFKSIENIPEYITKLINDIYEMKYHQEYEDISQRMNTLKYELNQTLQPWFDKTKKYEQFIHQNSQVIDKLEMEINKLEHELKAQENQHKIELNQMNECILVKISKIKLELSQLQENQSKDINEIKAKINKKNRKQMELNIDNINNTYTEKINKQNQEIHNELKNNEQMKSVKIEKFNQIHKDITNNKNQLFNELKTIKDNQANHNLSILRLNTRFVQYKKLLEHLPKDSFKQFQIPDLKDYIIKYTNQEHIIINLNIDLYLKIIELLIYLLSHKKIIITNNISESIEFKDDIFVIDEINRIKNLVLIEIINKKSNDYVLINIDTNKYTIYINDLIKTYTCVNKDIFEKSDEIAKYIKIYAPNCDIICQ